MSFQKQDTMWKTTCHFPDNFLHLLPIIILHLLLYYSYCFAPIEMAEGTLLIKQHVSIVYFIAVPDPGREVFSTLCDVPEWRRRRVDVINVMILILHSYVQYLGTSLSSRVFKNMSFCITADNYVCLLHSRKSSQIYTNTQSSRKLYNPQIKLYEITRTVEHINKSAHTEMSCAHLDFRLIANSTRHANEGTYTNINDYIWVNNQRVIFTSIKCTKYKPDLTCIINI